MAPATDMTLGLGKPHQAWAQRSLPGGVRPELNLEGTLVKDLGIKNKVAAKSKARRPETACRSSYVEASG